MLQRAQKGGCGGEAAVRGNAVRCLSYPHLPRLLCALRECVHDVFAHQRVLRSSRIVDQAEETGAENDQALQTPQNATRLRIQEAGLACSPLLIADNRDVLGSARKRQAAMRSGLTG